MIELEGVLIAGSLGVSGRAAGPRARAVAVGVPGALGAG